MQTSNILNIIHELTACYVLSSSWTCSNSLLHLIQAFSSVCRKEVQDPHQNKLRCNSLEEVHVLEYVFTHCVLLLFWVTHPTQQQHWDRPLQPWFLVTLWWVHAQHIWGLRYESLCSRKADYFWSHSLWWKSDEWEHFCLRIFNFDKKEQPIQSWGTERIKL